MIVVMTFNIGNGLAKPDDLIRSLEQSGADVIGLQEVNPEQGRALAGSLAELYPYRAVYPFGIPGKAILSKFEIREVELLEINPGRPDLRAVIDIPVQTSDLRVIVAHPPPPNFKSRLRVDRATKRQLKELVIHATTGEPTVMMGDFNATAKQQSYRSIVNAGMIDAFHAVGEGSGLTLPTRLAHLATRGHRLGDVDIRPFLRVDYIWHTEHLRATSAWVGDHAGSDHLPVFAQLEAAPHPELAQGSEAIVVAEGTSGIDQTPEIRRIRIHEKGDDAADSRAD